MLGTSIAWKRSPEWKKQSLDALKPAVWMDWTFRNLDSENYFPVVFDIKETSLNRDAKNIAETSDKIWLIGNEPELSSTFIKPDVAVNFVKTWESKNWAAPGVVLSENGFLWLEEYIRLGGPVGNYWNFHMYEVNTPEDWFYKWNKLRWWMDSHKLVRPVIISETAGWDASVDQRTIMDRIVHIQQRDNLLYAVIWYSDADYWKQWEWANLRCEDGVLTDLGKHFVMLQGKKHLQFLTMVGNG